MFLCVLSGFAPTLKLWCKRSGFDTQNIGTETKKPEIIQWLSSLINEIFSNPVIFSVSC